MPRHGVEETRAAIAAAERAYPAWRARTAKERAAVLRRLSDLMLERQEELARLLTSEQGKPLAEARGEIAYAASFFEWFGEEAKRVYGDTIPGAPARQADRRPEGADRRHRRDHALELPRRDDHAQGRAGPCGRLHDRDQAGRADAAERARPRRPRARGGRAGRCAPGRDRRRRRRARDRRRADLEPGRPQALLHRLDRDREAADGAVRRHGEEGLARARRQRPVPRLRRRRPRRGGRGRDPLQVPQLRPDVRLGEPDPRPGLGARRVRRPLRGRRRPARRRQRARRRRPGRAADRRRRGREGRAARRRRDRLGRRARPRRPAARGDVLRADRAHGRRRVDGDDPRGDVRAGRRDPALRRRGGGDPACERHAVRARRVLLQPEPQPRLARLGGARVRDPRRQHGDHLDRGGAVRRDEGVGDRARGLEVRRRRLARAQVRLPRVI